MPLIHIQASPKLNEPVILATQADPEFQPLVVPLESAVRAEVAFKYDRDYLDKQFRERDTNGNWYVNSRIEQVDVLLDVEISDDELAVLERRHPTANRFVADGEEYQQDDLLAQRIADLICDATNRLLLQIRDSYGQEWLETLDPGAANFLDEACSKWQLPGGVWQPVRIGPHVCIIDGMTLGAADQYLQPPDWRQLALAVGQQNADSTGFSLLADARRRFRKGDAEVAIVQLNAAVEWAAGRFVHNNLATVIPTSSLREVLKQNYARLLSDWVLPLVKEKQLLIAEQVWQEIQELRRTRNDFSHPDATPPQLQQQKFNKLERAARQVISALIGLPLPKAPPYFPAKFGGGTA